MGLLNWQKAIHENAKNHGWWDEPRSFGDIVALCHSELSEALEEHRNGRPMLYKLDAKAGVQIFPSYQEFVGFSGKPEGIAVEMADCLIRILDWAEYAGVNMEEIVACKHSYNLTRPYRHGHKKL